VRLIGVCSRRVVVAMMRVVYVHVVMCQWLVLVGVLVALTQDCEHSDGHD
jgi:hypothetical protein